MYLTQKLVYQLRTKVSFPALAAALGSPFRFWRYLQHRSAYLALPDAEKHWAQRFVPMLRDDTGTQDARNYYYYQDCWAARKIFELKPASVLDVGCTVLFTGIISQFTPTVSVDVRPVQSQLPGLTNVKGDISNLELPTASQECVVSLCVIEHIGLGRYGDKIDPLGAKKAAKELSRVLKPGGHLLISALVGMPCLAFNAHRIFAVEEFLEMFPDLEVIDDVFLYPEYGSRERLVEVPLGQGVFYCVHFRKRDSTL
jgi:SAM-dependent methyltransferase